ncbi:hypothetical protein ACHQM5_006901 [Ranunculus cassubicifolius]
MATVKADRPVGSQVLGQIKKAPAESGGSLKAPASKTDPKKTVKGGKPARKPRRGSLDDESLTGENP